MRRLVLLIPILACGAQKPLAPLPAGGTHILFIGNSLTYTNDLPRTVEDVAALGGDVVRFGEQTGPNLALIDHLNGASNAKAAIGIEHWDYVVLQQGPTPPGICRDSLILSTKLFDPLIKAQGSKTAVFQTWPIAGPISWFDNISPSFVMAAASVNAVLLPAGDAWRRALTEDPQLPLYSGDGLHPAPLGTFLAALVIYERVTGHDARTLPARAVAGGRTLNVSEATIRLLQRAAHEAVTVQQLPPAVPATGAQVGPC